MEKDSYNVYGIYQGQDYECDYLVEIYTTLKSAEEGVKNLIATLEHNNEVYKNKLLSLEYREDCDTVKRYLGKWFVIDHENWRHEESQSTIAIRDLKVYK